MSKVIKVIKAKTYELTAQPFAIRVLVGGISRDLIRNDRGDLLFSDTLALLGNAVTVGGTIVSPILGNEYPKIILNLTNSAMDTVIQSYLQIKSNPLKGISTLLRIFRDVVEEPIRSRVGSNDVRLVSFYDARLDIQKNIDFVGIVNGLKTVFPELLNVASVNASIERFDGEKTLVDSFNEFLDQFPEWKPSPQDDEVTAYEKNRNYNNYRILEPLRANVDGENTWYATGNDGGFMVKVWISRGKIVKMIRPQYPNRNALLYPLEAWLGVRNTNKSFDNLTYPKILVNMRTRKYIVIPSAAFNFTPAQVAVAEDYYVLQVKKPVNATEEWTTFVQGENNISAVDFTQELNLLLNVIYLGTSLEVRGLPYSSIDLLPPATPTTTLAPTTTAAVTTTVAPTTTV